MRLDRRRALGLGLGVLILALASLFGLYHLSRARCFAIGAPAICRVETDRPIVALTFDDGPTPLGVETVLPILEQRGVRATFFLIGEQIQQRPELARRLLAAGHELGNHSYSHVQMLARPPGFYDREIERTEALLRQAGSNSGLFRPPYSKKLVGLPLSVRSHGLRMIMIDVEEPMTRDPVAYANQLVAAARPGSILLIHPMYPANATARAALPRVLDGLKAKGLQPVTVGELLKAAKPAAS